MYLELNNIFRAQFTGFNPLYQGGAFTKYYHEDTPADASGPHLRALLFTNQPEAQEVGFNANEAVTGYMQFGVFLPATDGGLNYSLAEISEDAHAYFSRKNFVSGDIKFEILNTEKSEPLRIDGFFTVTLRVNYRATHCT